ncbi:MAG: hypothetical protein D6826_08830, partial [Alphaproteobacteria bacterium]
MRSSVKVLRVAVATCLGVVAGMLAGPVAGMAAQYEILVSTSSDRANPVPLDGQSLSGPVYIFTSPDTGVRPTRTQRVDFYLDDPGMTGAPIHSERRAPYDFAGGDTGRANSFDPDTLAPGAHTITASLPLADGTRSVVHATFTTGGVAGNRPPVFDPVAPQTIGEGTTAMVTLSARDPDGDPVVLEAADLPPFASFYDNGDGSGELDMAPAPGDAGTYAVRIVASDFTAAAATTVQVDVTAAGAPVIVRQPQSQTVIAGQSATFTLGVDGIAPFSYQWQLDGRDVAGATGASFTIGPVGLGDDGTRVRAIVADANGTAVTSAEATLTVRASAGLVADADNPRWLRYGDGRRFFLCSAGNPENFLYRGTRQADGTRRGDQDALIDKLRTTGANGIYMQIIRSHGGDGGTKHNPFVNGDPALGLDEDILNQWDAWFTAMDRAGIVVYLFFYDDGASIWAGGDAVPAAERAFIEAIVSRFKHIDNLIWVIAEEYQEVFTPARVSNMAAIIRAADERAHPIAVHKLNGLSFTEFADDPNIDQYAIQYNEVTADQMHQAMVAQFAAANGRYNLNMSESKGHGTGTSARRKNWAAAMGGAYVMNLEWDIASTSTADLKGCGYMVDFFEATNFDIMEPRDDLAFGGTDYVLAAPAARSYI